jgi:hypothetical protein
VCASANASSTLNAREWSVVNFILLPSHSLLVNQMKKWIFIGAVVIIAVVVAASLISRTPQKTKMAADEYFDVYVIGYYGENETSQLYLSLAALAIMPVLGNATETYMSQIPGMTENEDLGTILQWTNKTVDLELEQPVYLHLSDKGYAFSFYLTCYEADGEITVYLKPK